MNVQVLLSAGSLDNSFAGGMSFEMDSSQSLEGIFNEHSEVGVLLPTYCEAQNIERLIDEIEDLDVNTSILVIDDSSPDGTSDMVRDCQRKYDNILLFVRPKKSGLGTAITDGFRIFLSMEAPPEYVITMDADYSHNPKDILRLVSVAKSGSGLVIGSRYCRGGSTLNWGPLRLVISRIANTLASLMIGARIHDYTSGFRCYSTDLIRRIVEDLHSQTYEIQIETIRQAWKRMFKVVETPVAFVNRKKGKSKLTPNEIRGFLSYIVSLECRRG
ncbi:glycosyltransferase [Candidatus Bathyarchaeota archaeon]|nr:glycosyltransferase [Candidatus Bathyarchaeota archaeon]